MLNIKLPYTCHARTEVLVTYYIGYRSIKIIALSCALVQSCENGFRVPVSLHVTYDLHCFPNIEAILLSDAVIIYGCLVEAAIREMVECSFMQFPIVICH